MKKSVSQLPLNQSASTSRKSGPTNVTSQYTPAWLTPQEKAKLKARVMRIRRREKGVMIKEEASLLKAPPPDDDLPDGRGSVVSTRGDDKREPEDTKKDTNMDKSTSKEGPEKSKSKESMKKQKSHESVKNDKGGKKKKTKDTKEKDKGKNKEELAMSKKKHPKEEHANPTGNVMANQQERELNKHNLESHLWATDYTNFNPQLYHFKSPEKLSTKNPVLAECPPFWVLLDHTIAVMWKMFSPQADRNDLGIVPLQWSREFISAMRDERGLYLPAIAHVLNAIEDALLDRYSKTVDLEDVDDHGVKDKEDESEGGMPKDRKKQKEQAKEKDQPTEKDTMSYASSESIFKHPFEVSYTLKDILSRNLPGRMKPAGDDSAVKGKKPVVSKVDVPAPSSSVAGMKKEDLLNYLKHLKEEQEARVEKEKEYASKIDGLMEIIRKDKLSPEEWVEALEKSKKPEHVQFDKEVEGDEHKEVHRVKSKDADKDKTKGSKDHKEKGNDEHSVKSYESVRSSRAASDESNGSVSSTSTAGSTASKKQMQKQGKEKKNEGKASKGKAKTRLE